MRLVRIWCIWLSLLGVCWLATGGINPASAAEDKTKARVPPAAEEGKIQFEGRGEGFRPEGKEEAKEDECPPTFGPLIADTAVPIDTGRFAIQPYPKFRFTTSGTSPSWRRISAGGNYFTFEFPVRFTYGLMKNTEVYLIAGYKHQWVSEVNEPGPNGERRADYGGWRDVNLTAKYQLMEDRGPWPAVSAAFSVDFPAGHNYRLNPGKLGVDAIGSGSYTFYPGLLVSKCIPPVLVYGNLWYSFSASAPQRRERDEVGSSVWYLNPRDVLLLYLAAEYPIRKGPWVLLFEWYAEFETGRLFGPKPNSETPAYALIGISPGLEYMYSPNLGFAVGLSIDLAGKNVPLEVTPIVSMIYSF